MIIIIKHNKTCIYFIFVICEQVVGTYNYVEILNDCLTYHIKILSTGVPGEAVQITSEEEIFDYINYPYKKPEERNM